MVFIPQSVLALAMPLLAAARAMRLGKLAQPVAPISIVMMCATLVLGALASSLTSSPSSGTVLLVVRMSLGLATVTDLTKHASGQSNQSAWAARDRAGTLAQVGSRPTMNRLQDSPVPNLVSRTKLLPHGPLHLVKPPLPRIGPHLLLLQPPRTLSLKDTRRTPMWQVEPRIVQEEALTGSLATAVSWLMQLLGMRTHPTGIDSTALPHFVPCEMLLKLQLAGCFGNCT